VAALKPALDVPVGLAVTDVIEERAVHTQCKSYVPRAQRTTKWCAADPGSRWSEVPDQRCTAISASKTRVNALMALHRIRDTKRA
jgi:hypothetical protein